MRFNKPQNKHPRSRLEGTAKSRRRYASRYSWHRFRTTNTSDINTNFALPVSIHWCSFVVESVFQIRRCLHRDKWSSRRVRFSVFVATCPMENLLQRRLFWFQISVPYYSDRLLPSLRTKSCHLVAPAV